MQRSLDRRADGYELFEINSFGDLDLESLLPMLDRSWRADYVDEVRLLFDQPTLRKLMPGSWWVAVLACSPAGEPVGFELALERTLRVRDHVLRAYYASVFTVCVDHRGKGLGRWILEGINRLVFEKRDVDVIVSSLHEGHAGSPTVQSTFDRIDDWGVVRFHQSPIWSRRLDKDPLQPLEAPPESRELVEDSPSLAEDLSFVEHHLRTDFQCSFAFDRSLSQQYLDPDNPASGMLLYELGPEERCLVGYNVLPMAINEKALRPIGQLQLLAPLGCRPQQIAGVVHDLALRLAERGCFALSLVNMGTLPVNVLEELGFAPTEDVITFAARGPTSRLEPFEGLRPPFFLDFT